MKVTLRQRKKGDKISLYLDYYHQGKRSYEYLQLYLYPEPEKGKLTKEQKKENKDALSLAETIRAKRHLEVQNGVYGMQDSSKLKGSFIKYMEHLMEKRKDCKGNYDNWDSSLKHLKSLQSIMLLSQRSTSSGWRILRTTRRMKPKHQPRESFLKIPATHILIK